jgi:cytidyltransferase-like protein
MPKKLRRKKLVKVLVSGGFDPIHPGHIRLFHEAKKLGNKLIVLLNNDNWLLKKKGFTFFSQKERAEVIAALRDVDEVRFTSHKPNPADMSVCADLLKLRPDIFAQGGDRKKGALPGCEVKVCAEIGCKMVYNVGPGGKVQSSSIVAAQYFSHAKCSCGSGKMYIDCGLKNTKEHKRLLMAMLNKDVFGKK